MEGVGSVKGVWDYVKEGAVTKVMDVLNLDPEITCLLA